MILHVSQLNRLAINECVQIVELQLHIVVVQSQLIVRTICIIQFRSLE
jgi:hypothetical protein